MRREELAELHYITAIVNVPSILAGGILSHRRASKVSHRSVAKKEIQEIRKKVVVPPGRPLHEYANLYICGRNPMLYLILRQVSHEEICVLRVSPDVLDLPGVVIADRNAASDHVLFGASPSALANVDRNLVFAQYWTHPHDEIQEWRHKSIKCAEVLVPDLVPAHYVSGAYVSSEVSRAALLEVAPGLTVTVDGHMFFR